MNTFKNTIGILVAVAFFNAFASNAFSIDDKSKNVIIKGIIVDENGNRINSGFIRIFKNNFSKDESKFIESVCINSNGTFESKNPLSYFENDDIKIAAYPYDIDLAPIPPIDNDKIIIAAYPYDVDAQVIKNTNKTDDITIAAYPYDLDNGILIIPVEVHLNKFIESEDNSEIEIVITVKRINIETVNPSNSPSRKNFIKLNQNFPNPFNPSTLISFNLPESMNVTIEVYNLSGKLISTLVENKTLPAGDRHVQFNAQDLPSGIYIYKLTAGKTTLNKKMMLLK